MKQSLVLLTGLLILSGTGHCQFGGNTNYSQDREISPAQNERNKRNPIPAELRADNPATFIEASVLMNVKADEYVAVFGVATSAETVAAANAKMDQTIASFKNSLKPLGIKDDDLFVDFVAQTKIYGFRMQGTTASEQLVGFETKKNIAIRFKDKALVDKLVLAAADASIYDLIKVDYVVHDAAAIQDKLMVEAARIIKAKTERQQTLFGIKQTVAPRIVVDKPSIYYPTALYDSYSAFESETIRNRFDNERITVQEARKSKTFYFNPLDGKMFDTVINPVIIEPVVQFTAYVKVKYEPTKKK
jgi:uncharacterized protein YggE